MKAATCSIQLEIADAIAIAVGQTLRMLVRHGQLPPDAREIYERVGIQMVAVARTAQGSGNGAEARP